MGTFLGWLFDGFEMGLFPLIGQPALKDLLGAAASPDDANKWFGAIIAVFLVGAASGGVIFGLHAGDEALDHRDIAEIDADQHLVLGRAADHAGRLERHLLLAVSDQCRR